MKVKNSTGTYGTKFQFAELNGIKPASVLKRHCITGSYFGVVPKKKPNGHLKWPLIDTSEIDRELSLQGGC